jgi:DNA polymerase-3 subunit beta
MNITCDREELTSAFQAVAPVSANRSPKPILQKVKLEFTADRSVAMATDTEIGIRREFEGTEVVVSGSIVVPVNKFGLILRESSDEKLNIQTDGTKIVVRGQRSQFELPAENPDEFPEVTGFYEDRYASMPARLLKELIRRTIFATDTESSRYALGGVLLEFLEQEVVAVGTDGRRLAKMQGPVQSHANHHQSDSMTIVPSKAMLLIDRTLSDPDAEVYVAARPNDVLIKTPNTTIYTRLVEGRFPKWRDVIPAGDGAAEIDLTVGPFFAAVRQAAITVSEESRGLTLSFGDGTLVLSGSAAEVGSSRVEMPISYDGETVNVSLDHRFVADFLKVLDPEKTIKLKVSDNDHAALMETDDGYLYVVMPMSKDAARR